MVCLSRTARPCHTPCAAASTEEHGDLGMAPNGELRVPTSSSTAQIHIKTLWEMLAERRLA